MAKTPTGQLPVRFQDIFESIKKNQGPKRHCHCAQLGARVVLVIVLAATQADLKQYGVSDVGKPTSATVQRWTTPALSGMV